MIRRLKAAAGRAAADSRPWYRIANAADDGDGPARVDVYDEIGGSWFSDGVSAGDFVKSLAAIPDSRELHVHVNSPGGDVWDGLAIYNAIAQRSGPVTTVVDGLAASAASFIVQAGKSRIVSPGSMMMIHNASGLCIGNAGDMRELADLLELVDGNLADIYAAHSGRPVSVWAAAMQAETWYKADQAVAEGLADKLAERPAAPDAMARFDLSVFAKAPAWLRARPGAAADGEDEGGGGAAKCKTCGGSGRLKHPATGKNSQKCPSCGGTGTYDPDEGDGGEDAQDAAGGDCPTCDGTGKIMEGHRTCPDCHGTGKAPAEGEQDRATRPVNAPGKPFEPEPYRREADETVQCPSCKKFNDVDATYCDQCGTKLAGRTDVEETAGPGQPSPGGGAGNRAGLVPEDALTVRLPAIARQELRGALPSGVKSKFTSDLKAQPVHEIGAAIHRLSEWSASGHYPAGMSHADIQWMYDQCTQELKRRNPDSDAGGNLPPADAAAPGRLLDCHFLVEATTAAAAAAGKNDGAGNHAHAHLDLSGVDLEQLGNALKGALA